MKTKFYPYMQASRASRLFYCWLNDVLREGSSKKLELDDTYDVLLQDSSDFLYTNLKRSWDSELKRAARGLTPSLVKALARTYGPYVLIWSIVFVLEEIVKILCPFLIGGLIKHFSDESGVSFVTYMYALGICLCSIFPTVVHHPYFLAVFSSGMRMRISCCALLYRKLLKLNLTSMGNTATGQVVNLMSNDVFRFDLAIGLIPFLFFGPLEVLVVSILLWFYIGWSGICGMVVLLLVIPLMGGLAKVFARLRDQVTSLTDARLCLMNEFLNGIQLIKMSCLESYMEKIITNSRMSVSYSESFML